MIKTVCQHLTRVVYPVCTRHVSVAGAACEVITSANAPLSRQTQLSSVVTRRRCPAPSSV